MTDEEQLYTVQLKKLTAENFPSDNVNPAVISCSNANNFEHRRAALTVTVAIYQAFGYSRIEQIHAEISAKQTQLL